MRWLKRRLNFRSGCAAVCAALAALIAWATFAADVDLTKAIQTSAERNIAAGPFQPTWESLEQNYHCPDWFRDAKFGIWAHWTAQCVPEQGDWYARRMYIQGDKDYQYQVAHYGHPSEFGFKDIDNLWHAENWDPEKLMQLYKAAGAKYFVALANHHDNFDNYDSKYHEWNSVRVGPHKDIVGTWAKVARENGLRFGVTNHSAHAWHWFQTAYGYDAEGDKAGVPYDGFLTMADGKGKWWEGLDPQELYTGPNMVMPPGLKTIKEGQDWHNQHDRKWTEEPPPDNPKFVNTWFLRCQDLVDKYHPDLLYFDDTELPLGQTGLDIAAHYYNSNMSAHAGHLEAVLDAKKLKPEHRAGLVEDYERGFSDQIQPDPWQTDTCIGQWHYDRGTFERHRYKTVGQVVRMLVDIVSKNGNLLLNIPVKGDGTIDSDEVAVLQGLAKWMDVNGEGIFGTRPWTVYGEGPTKVTGGMFNEGRVKYTADDLRFTTKDGTLYVFCLGLPTGEVNVKALGLSAATTKPVSDIKLLGSDQKLKWEQTDEGLTIHPPEKFASEEVAAFRVNFK
ncbi:MAG TPA: alpha-L-fucosidase [Pirellulales bacterium]|nr:alpha-L-fucosidase [Pirellulales bacterium]